MLDPIALFEAYWRKAKAAPGPPNRNAVCISTIGENGFPNARFVDLKEVSPAGFVFCTHLGSSKAVELARCPKAALSLWWEPIGVQIRAIGECSPISPEAADKHWATRSRDGQLASLICKQDEPLTSLESLRAEMARVDRALAGQPIERPAYWGGFCLKPQSIEFLEFRDDRLHVRTLYAFDALQWRQSHLQP